MENREHAETAAAAWIARRERDDWSDADEAQLTAWTKASPDNRVAWLRINTAWQQTNRLRALTTSAPPGAVPTRDQMHLPFFESRSAAKDERKDERSESSSSTLYRRREREGARDNGKGEGTQGRASGQQPRGRARFYAFAATALLAVAAVAWYALPHGPSYRTDIGALQAVPLSDGSRVTLNTNTQIRVDVTPEERGVNLEQGEAYFEVAQDPSRPFVVRAGDKRIIAVGTQFSVRRDQDDVRVIVTEGKVLLQDSSTLSSREEREGARASGKGEGLARGARGNGRVREQGRASGLLIKAGSIARTGGDGVLVQQKPVAEVDQLLSWRTGFLAFDQTPLADAVAEFNRYNKRRIIIDDPSVAAIRVGGNFRSTNVDAFVRLIESDFPITAAEKDNQIILTGMPPPKK